ncbi:MAG: NADH-quinone oxidoreductase subunit D [Candidatus Eisenbacteria bacterium]|nr:NADH-quinone oxidoreductase subunit D [Candidatus Latescibacterota bacterium]MBD3303216.1 NADH-quinone oxidoreductase subunit D [Candidatus Eisenbacteria bacterium]
MPVFRIKREAIADALRFLRDEPGLRFNMLTDLTVVDCIGLHDGDRFDAVYLLHSLERRERVALKCPVPEEDPFIDSATPLFKNADWLEREAYDQYGVVFRGHPNLKRILNHKEFVGHPLRKDYDIYKGQWLSEADDLLDELEIRHRLDPKPRSSDRETMTLNMGPSHPASHGTLRNLVELEGETVLYAIPEIGYLHRGFEKSAETHEYNQVVPYTDRLNYCSALINNVAYVKAVEELCGIEITERCKYIRVIITELSRIMDHLVCNAANLVDIGALTNYWYLFNLREKIYNVLESLTGARLTNSYARVGGLWADTHPEFEDGVKMLLKETPKHVNDTLKLVARNRIFLDRTVGVGAIGTEEAISYGFTGPCLRATGYEYDLRKELPYDGYDRFEFDVPSGHQGDVYDRVMVRFAEIFESCRIVEQALAQMPAGPVNVEHPSIIIPSKKETHGSIEGLVNHFKIVMHGVDVPKGDGYAGIEAANGELGFYIVSDGEMKPYKCKVRAPCFQIYSAYPRLVEGGMVADAVAVLGSLNVIAGELDR